MKKLLLITFVAYAGTSTAGSFKTVLNNLASHHAKAIAAFSLGASLDCLHATSACNTDRSIKNHPCTIGTIANCAAAGTVLTTVGAGFLNEYGFHEKNVVLEKIELAGKQPTKHCLLVAIGALAMRTYRGLSPKNK